MITTGETGRRYRHVTECFAELRFAPPIAHPLGRFVGYGENGRWRLRLAKFHRDRSRTYWLSHLANAQRYRAA